ncbi:general secretion pathway protein L GspL [Rhodoplanes sp. Z2-YC6860]|nr:general secretion pathway protein L GspL [Rhodoplanes sp. Z2-YC6860]
MVMRDNGRLTLRQRHRDGKLGAITPIGSGLPGELAKTVKQAFVVFEMPEQEVVLRTIKVPAQAREYLSGIVRNQIDRLSPWPPQDAIYGFEAHPNVSDPGSLDVQISVAPRSAVENTRDELRAAGLQLDQITVRKTAAPERPPIPLWSREASDSGQQLRTARFAAGGALAATVVLSAAISTWALWSATSMAGNLDETTTRSRTLQRLLQVGRSPQALAALPLPERAWAFKETSYSAVFALEGLSRALPDTAYLTDFRLEKGLLRITGLTSDAPALIAPLEQSGHFANVRFSAATTRSAESGLFTFNIEANQERRLNFAGK